jgi:hypothetical protein
MKKTTSTKLLTTVFLVFAFLNLSYAQHEIPVRTMNVPAVVGVPPHLDGLDNDECWSSASAVTEVFYNAGWTGSSDLSGYIKLCWDNYYLYVFANIVDDIAENWPESGAPYQYDNIMVCLESDTSNPGIYGTDAINYRLNRGVLYSQTGTAPRNEAILDFYQVDGIGSWQIEFAIPWLSFLPENTPPDSVWSIMHKNAVGFDVIFSDADGAYRDAMSAWDADIEGSGATEGDAANNTQQFGVISLTGTPFTNYRPIAVASEDLSTDENTTVTLSNAGSYDPELEPITYHWSSANELILSDPLSATTNVTIPEVNGDTNFTVNLIVNDGTYNSYPDKVNISVRNINKPPVANAGVDQTVNEVSMVALNGSLSSDPDPQTLYYNWSSLQGVSLINPNQAMPLFFAPDITTNYNYTFVLTVSDGDLQSAPDTVSVMVFNKPAIKDTVFIYDSSFVYDTIVVHDSVFSTLTVYDTVFHFDSVFVFDTIIIHDSVFSTLTIYDTIFHSDSVFVFDTVTIRDSVFSTLTVYDTLIIRDSVFVFDTLYSSDTVRIYNSILITVVDNSNNVVVREVSGNLHVKLFPNPTDVLLKLSSEYSMEKIEIVNSGGMVVYGEIINSDSVEIDISDLSTGIYFVEIYSEYGTVSKTLVIE